MYVWSDHLASVVVEVVGSVGLVRFWICSLTMASVLVLEAVVVVIVVVIVVVGAAAATAAAVLVAAAVVVMVVGTRTADRRCKVQFDGDKSGSWTDSGQDWRVP